MQAFARYDFNATATDELSFQKGAVLKVSPCAMDRSCVNRAIHCLDPEHGRRRELVQSRIERQRRLHTQNIHRHGSSAVSVLRS